LKKEKRKSKKIDRVFIMATNKDPGIDDVKGIVALAVFVIYIILSVSGWLGFAFSISSAIALITFFIAFLGGIRTKKNTENDLDMAGVIVFIIWLVFFAVWVSDYLPDYSGRLMFLMFTAAIATSMKPKDIILFLGLSLLTSFFFESGALATMVLIVTALFAYACRESVGFGVIMMVPLLMVGWFVGSGWGVAVTQKIDSLGTQLGATTGISTEGTGDKISAMFNDTWLLLTNPNAWYEKQNAIGTTRDEGATSAALEITKIEALPASMNSKDTFDISFELENKGTKHAQNIYLGAKATTLANACGKINGKFCNLACIMNADGTITPKDLEQIKDGCPIDKAVKDIAPLEKRFDTFGFRAPECPGTYSVSAMVIYDYDVDATLNMQMISRDYYNELIRNNKMVWIDELSTTSAGPFKLSLRTDRKQPIPDTNEGGRTPQKFRIYLGFVNEHQGRAVMNFANIGLPKEFESVGWDKEANIFDDSCNIFYGVPDINGKYFEDALKEKLEAGGGTISSTDYSTLENQYRLLAINEEKTTNSGYLTYRIVDSDKRKMNQNEWRYYKCGFQLSPGTKIDQIQTLFARANMNYTFEYEKETTVTVRSTAVAIPHCDKKLQPISAISTAQTIPQTNEAITKELANEMFNCYNTNDKSIYHTSSECGKFKIDLSGCVDTITVGDITSKLTGEPYVRIMKNVNANLWVLEKTYDKADAPLKYIDLKNAEKSADVVFKSDTVYQISMKYVSNDFLLPFLMTNPFGVALSIIRPDLIRNSLLISIDSSITDPLCITAV